MDHNNAQPLSGGCNGSTQVMSRPTPQMYAQVYGHGSAIVTGQEVFHHNFQQQQSIGAGANQNRVVGNALSSDKRWTEYSENNLPIPNGGDNGTIPEDEMGFVEAVSVSSSTHATLLVSMMGQRNPTTASMAVLESPMITTPSFQSVPLMSNGGAVQYQQQGGFQSEQNSLQLQQQELSYQGGGDDDPYLSSTVLYRNHVVCTRDDLSEGLCSPFKPSNELPEIFSKINDPVGNIATAPIEGDMSYYSKFDLSGDGLQPIEESSNPSPATASATSPPARITPAVSVPPTISTPAQVQMPLPASTPVLPVATTNTTAVQVAATSKADSMLSNLTLEPPISPTYSYIFSVPSPGVPIPPTLTPSTPQVSIPGTIEQALLDTSEILPPSPPTNVCLFDYQCYEKNGKMFLELLICNGLPEAERQFALNILEWSAQFCMDLKRINSSPADLMISFHVYANICDPKLNCEQSKLDFSIPASCKHVNQWISEKGLKASFLDCHAVLQQVLNTMAAIHNGGSDKSLWGCFMVFVAPDLSVYVIPDIIPMLIKMQGAVGDDSFPHPRYEDSRAIFELYKLLIPPTISKNLTRISPLLVKLLQSFVCLVQDLSSVFKMPELARIMGVKRMCQMEVDCCDKSVKIFCVEHELVLVVLTSIMDMIPTHATIMWTPSLRLVSIQDMATVQMKLQVSYN